MRAFLAIIPPEEIKEELSRITHGIPGVKWKNPETFHLTLQFLGEISEEITTNLNERISCIKFEPFTVNFHSVGFFHSAKGGYTIWTGVDKNPSLISLYDSIQKIVNLLQLKTGSKDFIPHLTIGKTYNWNFTRWDYYFETYREFKSLEFGVQEFHLFSSELKPSGAIYTIEKTFVANP
ncbi:MAG: RNA 2',3'-cyclic phosphodiesterase [Leptospiraceae bacterium]|nr:RNA 2',3'-cyclic phosphodiesterase [Leptospiraceae bacterium]